MEEPETFKVGLCLAGAISAGAYTAGVIDFLLEALEEWETRRISGEADVPGHRVEISVVGGSSAGGMTGMILASALGQPITPVIHAPPALMTKIPSNPLYHSWVDLVHDDMLEVLLDSEDITKRGLRSLLNAEFIDRIADRVFIAGEPPARSRPYISKNLKVFVTLANLRGMEYSFGLRSNTHEFNKYISTSHRDYVCFSLTENESQYKNDGFIPLNFEKGINVELAKQAAMATGAFPLGLPAREVTRKGQYLNDLEWFKYITRDGRHPFPDDYVNLNVDGGMINNEPFEKVRALLDQESPDHNHHSFQNTVLLVDPFPSKTAQFNGNSGLFSVMGSTLNAMINQSRVKPRTLLETMDETHFGQFMIAPVRHVGEEVLEGTEAIACAAIAGFGGFVSKEFRIHDYFLGRANCEKFLRDHFAVPQYTTNPIFTEGYAGVSDKSRFLSQNGKLQIIPLFTPAKPAPYMPQFRNGHQFPDVNMRDIVRYRPKIKKRIEKILLKISPYTATQRVLLWVGARVVLNAKLADVITQRMIDSLDKHRLLK